MRNVLLKDRSCFVRESIEMHAKCTATAFEDRNSKSIAEADVSLRVPLQAKHGPQDMEPQTRYGA